MKKVHLIISLLLCSSVSIFGVKSEIKRMAEPLIENDRQNEAREQIQYVARRDRALYIVFNDLHTGLERSQYLERVVIRIAIISIISSVTSIGIGLYYFFNA